MLLALCSAALDDEQDDSEVESLLHQISDSRHAGDRRDAMSQLSHLLQDNPRVRSSMQYSSCSALECHCYNQQHKTFIL